MKSPPTDSLERINPHDLEPGEATGAETLQLHLARYEFAARHLPAGRVLDLACGVGYGSALLAGVADHRSVIGADISASALAHARAHYASSGVHFVRADGAGWLRGGALDAVVSLETLEHVPDPKALFAQFVGAVRSGGAIVASVPITPSVDANPHHLTDFDRQSFLGLGAEQGLTVLDTLEQVQSYSPFAVIARSERRTQGIRRGLAGYYLRHPGALARRLGALARFGFTNRYLTVAWRRD